MHYYAITKGPQLAQCANSAYDSLTGFTARSGPLSKARNGSTPELRDPHGTAAGGSVGATELVPLIFRSLQL